MAEKEKKKKKKKTYSGAEAHERYKRNKKPDIEEKWRTTKPGELDKEKKEEETKEETKTIKAEKEKTGIEAYREKDTLGGKATKVLTSPKTTMFLAGTLASLVGGAAIAGASRAITSRLAAARSASFITRTATIGKRSLTTQRAITGKAAHQMPKLLEKSFHKVRPIAQRYATNKKSLSLTKSMLNKAGLSMGAAGLAVGAIGSYPFAGFIKEEAVQNLGMPIQSSIYNGDLESAKKQIEEIDNLINNKESILQKIPYANVLYELNNFFEAANKSNQQWKNVISLIENETQQEVEKDDFKEREEERRKRDLEDMQFKSQYYDLIREGRYNEADELLNEREESLNE